MARWVSSEARPYKSHVGVSRTNAAKIPSIMKRRASAVYRHQHEGLVTAPAHERPMAACNG
jgi:hypothetical protein